MALFLLLYQLCLGAYLAVVIWFILGQFRSAPDVTDRQPYISVIVAIRNGAHLCPTLLKSLTEQSYPGGKLELVLVDDRSTDGTGTLLQAAAEQFPNIVTVHSDEGDPRLTHKKRALDAGIRRSSGEILLFTDVDCRPGPEWVAALVSHFTPAVDYVIGWSEIGAETEPAAGGVAGHRPFALFEQLDFYMLMLAAKGTALMGKPMASSGQNQAYRRKVFDNAGGFDALIGRLQGDDSLFLQLARRRSNIRTAFAFSPTASMITQGSSSFRQFLAQRARWAGDAAVMWRFNRPFYIIPLLTFTVTLLTVVALVSSLFAPGAVLPTLVPAILLKALFEGSLLWIGTARMTPAREGGLDPKSLRRHFPLWFILQFPYILYVGIISISGNRGVWHGRPAIL